jgi:hypothetical protein
MMNKSKIGKGTALAALVAISAFAGAQGISVNVDGQAVRFRDASPKKIDGRVLVPLRGVFEEMGATVQWRSSSREIIANRGDSDVRLHIGDKYATVDGKELTMDVPAQIIDGATYVPIRFLSESLGAQVRWREADQLVMIDTDAGRAQRIDERSDRWKNRDRNGDGIPDRQQGRDKDRDNNPPVKADRMATLEESTIIPVSLDTTLSSNESQKGDRFTATVRRNENDYYGMLPDGTKVEGRIVTARKRSGDNPGILELNFERIRLPSGKTYVIDGDLVSLDAKGIVKESNGRLKATGAAAKDNRGVYAGYGAGAGLIVGLLTKKPLEGTILGGILGYLGGSAQKSKDNPANVRLEPGTEFGIRLAQDLQVNLANDR